jgi:hypothetical protein
LNIGFFINGVCGFASALGGTGGGTDAGGGGGARNTSNLLHSQYQSSTEVAYLFPDPAKSDNLSQVKATPPSLRSSRGWGCVFGHRRIVQCVLRSRQRRPRLRVEEARYRRGGGSIQNMRVC